MLDAIATHGIARVGLVSYLRKPLGGCEGTMIKTNNYGV